MVCALPYHANAKGFTHASSILLSSTSACAWFAHFYFWSVRLWQRACGCEQGSTLPSSPPVAPSSTRSTHSTSAAAGVTSKSSSSAVAPPPLQLASATAKDHGSRFHTGPVEKGFVRIGWESPLSLWGSILGTEFRSCIFPAENVNAYSNLRERWHLAFCKPSSMLQWLLHMEEHSFYLFLAKAVATLSIRSRSSLSVQDRKKP